MVYIVDFWYIIVEFGIEVVCFNLLDWFVFGDVDMGDNVLFLVDVIIIKVFGDQCFWFEEVKVFLVGLLFFVVIDLEEDGQWYLSCVCDLMLFDGEQLMDFF